MPPKAKKRIIDLDVREIGFVDKAANRRGYLVFKSADGAPAGDDDQPDAQGADSGMPKDVTIQIDSATVAEMVAKSIGGESEIDAKVKALGLDGDALAGVAIASRIMKAAIGDKELPEGMAAVLGIKVAKAADAPNGDDDADTKIDLSHLPEEVRKQMESVMKSNATLAEQVKKAQDAADSEKDIRITGEFVAKAATSYKDVADSKQLGPVLKRMSDTMSAEDFKFISETFAATQARVEKSALFDSYGSDAAGEGGSAWQQIEKAAEVVVKDSAGKTDLSAAIDQVMADQPNLYKQYLAERGQAGRQ